MAGRWTSPPRDRRAFRFPVPAFSIGGAGTGTGTATRGRPRGRRSGRAGRRPRGGRGCHRDARSGWAGPRGAPAACEPPARRRASRTRASMSIGASVGGGSGVGKARARWAAPGSSTTRRSRSGSWGEGAAPCSTVRRRLSRTPPTPSARSHATARPVCSKPLVPLGLKLPRFRGHPLTGGDGVHDAEEARAAPSVPA